MAIKLKVQISEREEQKKVKAYLDMLERQGKILFYYAVPNGGTRNPIEAKNLKSEGVRAGVSDMCVIGKEKILYIEMKKRPKTLKNGSQSVASIKVSPSQIEFIEKVTTNPNIKGKVCYGFNQAKDFIDQELGLLKQKKDTNNSPF